jgi:hypothetical protein
MVRITEYYGRFNDARGGFVGLPPWARLIVGIAAIPGVVLLLLSLLAFAVSLLALLLLTVPVYSVLKSLTTPAGVTPADNSERPGVKRVQATIVE